MKIVVCDVETGGLKQWHTLLQASFAVVDLFDMNIVDELHLNLVPDDGEYLITANALEVNKINLAKHKGITIKDAEPKLKEFLGKHFKDSKPTFCAHNAYFDRGFIDDNFGDDLFDYRMLDSQVLAYELYLAGLINSPSLKNFCAYHNVVNDKAHSSKGDCIALAKAIIKHAKMNKWIHTVVIPQHQLRKHNGG